jgi:hypothetical protein
LPITTEIRSVLENGEIIEDYPEDPRGHSCLMLGYGDAGRPIHIACSPKKDFPAIITAYIPDKNEWSNQKRHGRKFFAEVFCILNSYCRLQIAARFHEVL